MAVTRAKKSSLLTGRKFNNAGAGGFLYPWGDGEQYSLISATTYNAIGTPTAPVVAAIDCFSFIEAEDGDLQGIGSWGGPGNQPVTYDGGVTLVQTPSSLSYGTYVSSFNGAFLGGGNYMTSSGGYTNNIKKGFTYISGYSSISASFGFGAGGFTSDNLPVYLVPVTTGGIHKVLNIAGAVGSKGVPSPSWTTTTVVTAAGNGYQARVALTNNVVVYAYHANTTPAAANFAISYAPVTASTGALGSFSSASISGVSGTLTSLVSVNGTFVLSTSSNQLYTSTDGSTWTARTSPFSGSAALYLSKESGGRIMAAPPTAAAYTPLYNSADGINWVSSTLVYGAAMTITAIATGPGIRATFLTVGGTPSVYRNNNFKLGS